MDVMSLSPPKNSPPPLTFGSWAQMSSAALSAFEAWAQDPCDAKQKDLTSSAETLEGFVLRLCILFQDPLTAKSAQHEELIKQVMETLPAFDETFSKRNGMVHFKVMSLVWKNVPKLMILLTTQSDVRRSVRGAFLLKACAARAGNSLGKTSEESKKIGGFFANTLQKLLNERFADRFEALPQVAQALLMLNKINPGCAMDAISTLTNDDEFFAVTEDANHLNSLFRVVQAFEQDDDLTLFSTFIQTIPSEKSVMLARVVCRRVDEVCMYLARDCLPGNEKWFTAQALERVKNSTDAAECLILARSYVMKRDLFVGGNASPCEIDDNIWAHEALSSLIGEVIHRYSGLSSYDASSWHEVDSSQALIFARAAWIVDAEGLAAALCSAAHKNPWNLLGCASILLASLAPSLVLQSLREVYAKRLVEELSHCNNDADVSPTAFYWRMYAAEVVGRSDWSCPKLLERAVQGMQKFPQMALRVVAAHAAALTSRETMVRVLETIRTQYPISAPTYLLSSVIREMARAPCWSNLVIPDVRVDRELVLLCARALNSASTELLREDALDAIATLASSTRVGELRELVPSKWTGRFCEFLREKRQSRVQVPFALLPMQATETMPKIPTIFPLSGMRDRSFQNEAQTLLHDVKRLCESMSTEELSMWRKQLMDTMSSSNHAVGRGGR